MKSASLGLAAATFLVGIAGAQLVAAPAAEAQTTSTQTTTGMSPASQGAAHANTGMAAPAGQGNAAGMVPGTPAGTAAASGNDNQAVATTPANATTPAHGANSFSMGEARRRIQARGFTQVAGLAKDRQGVWRGHAMHDGAETGVWLDYKGNIGTDAK